MTDLHQPAIGVIGGSGLYEIDGLTGIEEVSVKTPFGEPSDAIISGEFEGRRVCFLARHARGHKILPHELNHRANIWAMRSLGVRWLICVTAVGSLREKYAPRDIVLIDQFFDRTSRRVEHTFFGEGVAAHIEFAEPVSENLRQILLEASSQVEGLAVHSGGVYVNMDGPAFSTRAESETNRQLGFDVIGMTNLPEAKLAREAEIALSTMAMVTDYDCWKIEEDAVNVDSVIAHVEANAESAKEVLQRVVPLVPIDPNWPEHRALENAVMTGRDLWPPDAVEKLRPLLERFL